MAIIKIAHMFLLYEKQSLFTIKFFISATIQSPLKDYSKTDTFSLYHH